MTVCGAACAMSHVPCRMWDIDVGSWDLPARCGAGSGSGTAHTRGRASQHAESLGCGNRINMRPTLILAVENRRYVRTAVSCTHTHNARLLYNIIAHDNRALVDLARAGSTAQNAPRPTRRGHMHAMMLQSRAMSRAHSITFHPCDDHRKVSSMGQQPPLIGTWVPGAVGDA